MDRPTTLPPAPATPTDPAGVLLHGLVAGRDAADPVALGPRRGRVRRWCYAAAGDPDGVLVGAAVVSLGLVGTAFAFVHADGRTTTWERRLPGRVVAVGRTPAAGARAVWRGSTVAIDGDGGLHLDLDTEAGRVRATVEVPVPGTPATLTTATAAGGWNRTEKAAGHPARGVVEVDGVRRDLDGGGWRDWTAGRQDRHTVWRWAAGAGTSADGRRVGLNVSTGMNALADGEDVVWWDGVPHALDVTGLAPAVATDPAGAWVVGGPGWELVLEPWGVRAADEDLRVVRSRYVQPLGVLRGTLPGPDGQPVGVRLTGVTEDHEATW
ncbi:MAG: DUF2804 family protein [Actinomycetes bacterium]